MKTDKQQIEENLERIKFLERILTEIHSWIVCSAISTPEDMMKSAEWIEEITNI